MALMRDVYLLYALLLNFFVLPGRKKRNIKKYVYFHKSGKYVYLGIWNMDDEKNKNLYKNGV